MESPYPELVAFVRGRKHAAVRLLVLANSDMSNPVKYSLPVPTRKRVVQDLLGTKKVSMKKGTLQGTIRAGEVNVFLI